MQRISILRCSKIRFGTLFKDRGGGKPLEISSKCNRNASCWTSRSGPEINSARLFSLHQLLSIFQSQASHAFLPETISRESSGSLSKTHKKNRRRACRRSRFVVSSPRQFLFFLFSCIFIMSEFASRLRELMFNISIVPEFVFRKQWSPVTYPRQPHCCQQITEFKTIKSSTFFCDYTNYLWHPSSPA
jgi:hypothetical protein